MEFMRVSNASEGEGFDTKIDENGKFRVLCSVLRQEEEENHDFQGNRDSRKSSIVSASSAAPSQDGSSPRSVSEFGDYAVPGKNLWKDVGAPVRRRWVQFARDGSDDGGRFEILRGCNSGGAALMELFSLKQLSDAYVPEGETTMLHLTFSRMDSGVLHFALFFDSPLHLLRARQILESWTALTDIEEHRPVVVLRSDTSNKLVREVGWSQPIPYRYGANGNFWDDIRRALQRKEKDLDVIKTSTNGLMTFDEFEKFQGEDLKKLFPICLQVEAYFLHNQGSHTAGNITDAAKAASSWGGLPGPMTRNLLNKRFGTLWSEVKPALVAIR
jgi:hypothetical protein